MCLEKYLAAIEPISKGGRNAGLHKVGLSLRGQFALEGAALLDTLNTVNSEKCLPPLDGSEVERIAKSVDGATKVPCESKNVTTSSPIKKTKTKKKTFTIQLGETVAVAPLLETKIGVFNNVHATVLSGIETIGGYIKVLTGHWDGNDEWRTQAEHLRLCREAAAAGDKETKNKYKYLLNAVAPCCVPKDRTKGTIQEQNGIFLLDVDELTAENIETKKQRLAALPFVFAVGLSASGLGLWALCVLDSKTDLKVLLETLNNAGYGFTFDKSCSDAGRLRFLTRDANVIVKESVQKLGLAEVEVVDEPADAATATTTTTASVDEKNMQELFNELPFYHISGTTKLVEIVKGRVEPADKATAYNRIRNAMPQVPVEKGNGTRYLTDMDIDVFFEKKDWLNGVITTGTAPVGLVREMDKLYFNKGYSPIKDLSNVEPASEEELKLFIQNLGHVVEFDITHGKQVLKFISEIVKNPLDPAKMTKRQLVIQNADSGTGKDLLFSVLLQQLYGYDGAYLIGADAENVLGSFNGNLAGKIGFQIGEMKSIAQGGQLKISFEKMKQYNDGMFDTVKKGQMAEKHRDPVFMILTSNEDCLAPTNSTSRRGVFLGTDSKNDKFGIPTGKKLGGQIAELYKSEAGLRILKALSELDEIDVDMGAIEDRSGEWKYVGIATRLVAAAQRKGGQRDQQAAWSNAGQPVDVTIEYKTELKGLGQRHSKKLREYLTVIGFTVNTKHDATQNLDRTTTVIVDLSNEALFDDDGKYSNVTVNSTVKRDFTVSTQVFINDIFTLFQYSKHSKINNYNKKVYTQSSPSTPPAIPTYAAGIYGVGEGFTVFTVSSDANNYFISVCDDTVNENTEKQGFSPIQPPEPQQEPLVPSTVFGSPLPEPEPASRTLYQIMPVGYKERYAVCFFSGRLPREYELDPTPADWGCRMQTCQMNNPRLPNKTYFL